MNRSNYLLGIKACGRAVLIGFSQILHHRNPGCSKSQFTVLVTASSPDLQYHLPFTTCCAQEYSALVALAPHLLFNHCTLASPASPRSKCSHPPPCSQKPLCCPTSPWTLLQKELELPVVPSCSTKPELQKSAFMTYPCLLLHACLLNHLQAESMHLLVLQPCRVVV